MLHQVYNSTGIKNKGLQSLSYSLFIVDAIAKGITTYAYGILVNTTTLIQPPVAVLSEIQVTFLLHPLCEFFSLAWLKVLPSAITHDKFAGIPYDKHLHPCLFGSAKSVAHKLFIVLFFLQGLPIFTHPNHKTKICL